MAKSTLLVVDDDEVSIDDEESVDEVVDESIDESVLFVAVDVSVNS